jgi:hypothetical protein
MVGAGVFKTVTVKVQLPPPVSEATLTTVEPTGKKEPEAGVAFIAPQLPLMPLAELKLTKAPGLPPCVVLAVAVILAGQSNEQVSPEEAPLTEDPAPEVLSAGSNSAVSLLTVTVLLMVASAGAFSSTS